MPAADDDVRSAVAPPDLLYGLNDKPPLRLSLVVALQHVLAVFVGVVTPMALRPRWCRSWAGPFIHRARRIITPLVTGIVVTLIGLDSVNAISWGVAAHGVLPIGAAIPSAFFRCGFR